MKADTVSMPNKSTRLYTAITSLRDITLMLEALHGRIHGEPVKDQPDEEALHPHPDGPSLATLLDKGEQLLYQEREAQLNLIKDIEEALF